MEENQKANPPLWIHNKDKKGRVIDQRVIDAAHRIWKYVVYLTQLELHETTRAQEILESAVDAVSNRMRRHGNGIRDTDSYLFWTFVRKLNRVLEKNNKTILMDSLARLYPIMLHNKQRQLSAPVRSAGFLPRQVSTLTLENDCAPTNAF
jgi:hypothetical protein